MVGKNNNIMEGGIGRVIKSKTLVWMETRKGESIGLKKEIKMEGGKEMVITL